MRIRRGKFWSVVLTLSLLAMMLLPMAAPASAYTTTTVTPLSQPNVTTTFTGNLGTILVNGLGLVQGIPDTVTITLPSNVDLDTSVPLDVYGNTGLVIAGQYNPNTTAPNALNGGVSNNQTPIFTNIKVTQSMINFTFVPLATGTGSFVVNLPVTSVSGAQSGPINVMVQDTNNIIPAGMVTVGSIVTGGTITTVQSTASMAQNSSDTATILVSENSAGALKANNGYFTIALPTTHFIWGDNPTFSLGGGWSGWTMVNNSNPGPNQIGWMKVQGSSGNWKLRFWFGSTTTSAGTMQITDSIQADYNAPVGDIIASVSGTNPGVTATTLNVGTCGDYNVTTNANKVPTIYTGKTGQDIATFNMVESVAGTLVKGRMISLTLPGGIRWTPGNLPIPTIISGNVSLATGNLSSDHQTVTYAIQQASTTASTVQFTSGEVDVDAGINPGPLTVTITGSGIDQTATIANIMPAVTAKATGDIPTLNAGTAQQVAADFTITESAPGAISSQRTVTPYYAITSTSTNQPQTYAGYLNIIAPNGVTFDSVPTMKVTSGDLVLSPSGATLQGTNGGVNNEISIPIQGGSSQASTITVSGLKLNLDNSVATGPVKLEIGGSAVVDPVNINGTYATDVTVADCVGAGAAGKATAVFTIGSTTYSVNGQDYSMDVAPYTQNGRTFVPVRYAAEALGVSPDNILYQNGVVTIIKGSTVVQMTLGSNVMKINGANVTMDVPANTTSGRTMLPLRWLGTALGATFNWDASTQTVTVNVQ